MNILITAATDLELKPFIAKIGAPQDKGTSTTIYYKKDVIDILIHGIGLVSTTFNLVKTLHQKKYDLAINAGIAGSYSRNLTIGEVVLVEQEEFGDLGIEDEQGFKTLFEMNFLKKDQFPFIDGKLKCDLNDLPKRLKTKSVTGLTGNIAHGNQATINQLVYKFNPDIETMEGAAFFYVCLMERINFIEIRAISNYVEARDTKKWNIPLAIENLSKKLLEIIDSFAL